jgi:HEAT repeat protein
MRIAAGPRRLRTANVQWDFPGTSKMTDYQEWIDAYTAPHPAGRIPPAEWVTSAEPFQLHELFAALASELEPNPVRERMAAAILAQLSKRAAAGQLSPADLPLPELADAYRRLAEITPERYRLLQILAQIGDEQSLAELAELLVQSPPGDTAHVAQISSPLVQPARRHLLPALFPRLLDGLANLSTAAAILDLANYVTRLGLMRQHPATDRQKRLAEMLGDLAHRLVRIQEQPELAGAQNIGHLIAECVSLAVSLCDALALIGSPEHTGKLFRALDLPHRRIRTEAAFALTRLGEEAGEKALLELAAEPVARLRVLSYAEELGILEKVDSQYRTEEAQAEAALVLWLAEPTQLGMPPTSCELYDQQYMYWPGYQEPVNCYLFRFHYELGRGSFSNIGVSGPLVHALATDLQDLSPDDIYSVFAGWHVEHPDVSYREPEQLSPPERQQFAQFEEALEDEGFSDVQGRLLGTFFEDRVLIAQASQEQVAGLAAIDAHGITWRSLGHTSRPLGPVEMFCLYAGRRLLTTFNA